MGCPCSSWKRKLAALNQRSGQRLAILGGHTTCRAVSREYELTNCSTKGRYRRTHRRGRSHRERAVPLREPEERVFYKGRWYDGLYLHAVKAG